MAAPGNHGNSGNSGGSQTSSSGYQSGATAGGSGGAYDFADNTDVLQTVIDALDKSATSVETSISNIYGLLNGSLKDNWNGSVYDSFIGRCEFYHPALNELVTLLRAFNGLFTKVQTDATALNSNVASTLNVQ